MADAQKVIELIFKGVDQTSAATEAALANTSKFSKSVEDATQPIADFTLGALKIEAAILAAGAALTVFSVVEASKFQNALLDLQKVLGETDAPIEEFAAAASKISLEYGTAADDVLASVANFKQAGFDGAEALQLVRNALDLKIAGDLEAAQASDLLVASLKGFGLEAGEAGRVVDLLNEVSNRYATNVEELAIGFSRLSPVAKAAGLSLEETAGLLTPGIEVFRSGSEVANGLRTVLLRLQDDSKPVREALAALGVTQFDVNGELRSGRDIYFDVARALSTVEGGQKTYLAAQLAGLDQSAKFIAVTDGLAKTLEIAGKGFEYAGSAAKEVEIRLASTGASVDKAVQSFLGLARSIGQPLLDEFGGIADAIANIFQAIGAAVQETGLGGLTEYIESLFAGLKASLEEVARNLPAALAQADFSSFRQGIEAVVVAVRDLFGGLDITSVEGLTTAIESIGTAFLGLSRFTAGVIESFEPLVQYLIELGSGMRELDTGIFETLGNIGGLATQLNVLAGAAGGLIDWLTALVGVLAARQGLSLLGSLASIGPAASTAVAALAGPVGLVAALGAAAIAGTAYAVSSSQVEEAQQKAAEAGELYKNKTTELNAKLAELSEALGLPIKSYEEFETLLRNGTVVWDEQTNTWARAAESLTELGDVSGRSWEEIDKSNQALLAASEAADAAADATGNFADSSQTAIDKQRGWKEIIDETTGAVVGYEQVMGGSADATEKFASKGGAASEAAKKIADATKEAAEAQLKWNLEIEKLQAAERLALIEAQSAITTARIAADADVLQAAFQSLDSTIASTGDTIGKLGAALAGVTPNTDAFDVIQRNLEEENRRRDEALELQKQLVEAQIQLINARVEALNRGDALIQIDGAGLQPHLEAFMFEILSAIQVRVNQDGLEMLLGV